MKTIINVCTLFVCMGFLASCAEPKVDQTALTTKVEEQASAQIEKLQADYTANCEARLATEVKEKTDSILAARVAATEAQ